MSITGNQVVAARGLLRISQDILAEKAGVGIATLVRFEREDTDPRNEIREKIKTTLESLGVEFINGGVIPHKSAVQELSGTGSFHKLQDDVFETLKSTGGEVYLYGVNEEYADEYDKFHISRLKQYDIKQKVLTKKGSKVFLQNIEDYRFLGDDLYNFLPIIVYANKLAIVYGDTVDFASEHIIIIKNNLLADTFRKQFGNMWNKAEKGKK